MAIRSAPAKRICVWLCAVAFFVSVMLPPLVNENVCVTPEWEDDPTRRVYYKTSPQGYLTATGRAGPPILNIITHVLTGLVLPALLLTSNFDSRRRLHLMVRRLAIAISLQGFFSASYPWILMWCPSEPLGVAAMFSVSHAIGNICFLATIVAQLQITVDRLYLVASPKAARRASLLRLVVLFVGVFTAIAYGVRIKIKDVRLVFVTLAILCWLVLAAFTTQALLGFGSAVREARVELRRNGDDPVSRMAVMRAEITLVASAASTLTTMAFLLAIASTGPFSWARQLSGPLDLISNVAFALISAGLTGSWSDHEGELQRIGEMVQERRKRQIQEKLIATATGPALVLAALLEGVKAEDLISEAAARFRCVSWHVLAKRPDIILGGGALDGAGPVSSDLYALSEPCNVSECDAFISHSWHDNAQEKWAALQAWCEDFETKYGRPPKLWLDKLCIEQTNIQKDLQCLPIFLAGCDRLLVLSGSTYTSRLWCCLELFVYMLMLVDDPDRKIPTVITLSTDEREHTSVNKQWMDFDVTQCSCFNHQDKQRILNAIERYPEGASGFNHFIRGLSKRVLQPGFSHAPNASLGNNNYFGDDNSAIIYGNSDPNVNSAPPQFSDGLPVLNYDGPTILSI